MFAYLNQILVSYSQYLPLEYFVIIASFVEEVVAPIPSPTVMMAAGFVAEIQHRAVYALIPLAILGAVGKTMGALVVYAISNVAEDFVMRKFGRFFKVTHEDVEKLGSKLGNGARDYFFLTTLRALPFVPSVLVSVGSGLLKIPLPLFIVSTFFGTIVRDSVYLYAGYVGTQVLNTFVDQTMNIESYIELIAIGVVVVWIVLFILKKRKAF